MHFLLCGHHAAKLQEQRHATNPFYALVLLVFPAIFRCDLLLILWFSASLASYWVFVKGSGFFILFSLYGSAEWVFHDPKQDVQETSRFSWWNNTALIVTFDLQDGRNGCFFWTPLHMHVVHAIKFSFVLSAKTHLLKINEAGDKSEALFFLERKTEFSIWICVSAQ